MKKSTILIILLLIFIWYTQSRSGYASSSEIHIKGATMDTLPGPAGQLIPW